MTISDTFVGEEILGFGQSSLLPETIWLLDAGNVIWIWIGKFSIPKLLKECVHDAMIFLFTHPAGRDRNTTISVIKQGIKNNVCSKKAKISKDPEVNNFFTF